MEPSSRRRPIYFGASGVGPEATRSIPGLAQTAGAGSGVFGYHPNLLEHVVLLAFALVAGLTGMASATDSEAVESSQPLRLIFTAETQGNLVPCDCPEEPYGGLAQRSTFVRNGGSTKSPELLPPHPGTGKSPNTILRLHAGGFLPGGQVPLRRDARILHRYLELLLEDLEYAGFDAVGLGPEEAAFLQDRQLSRFDPEDPRWLLFGKSDLRLFPWDGRSVAVLALDANWPEETLAARGRAARSAGDFVIVLARANAFTGQKIARAAKPDLVVLSQGANLEQPLQREGVWLVGCGTHGKFVGACDLIIEDGGLVVTNYQRVPITAEQPAAPGLLTSTRHLIRDGHPDWYAHITSDSASP